MITTNYGLAKKEVPAFDVTKHVEAMRPGQDGYVDMDAYNKSAPWNRPRPGEKP